MGDSFAGITVPEGQPGELRAAGQTFAGISGALEGVSSELGALPGMLSAWQGPASVNYAGSVLTNGTALDSATEALQSASIAAKRYAEELEEAQDDARAAIDDARIAQQRIDQAEADIEGARARSAEATASLAVASARVVATGITGLPSPDALADQSAAAAAISDAETDGARAQRELEQAQEDLKRAQERGRRAEQAAREAARAVAGAFSAGGAVSPAFALFGAPGSAIVGGGAAPMLAGGRLYVGGRSLAVNDASPAEVAAFFDDIGPAQGSAVADAYPALVGPLNGAPPVLRYAANRSLIQGEAASLRDQLAQLEAAEEADDDGGSFLPIAMINLKPLIDRILPGAQNVDEAREQLETRIATLEALDDPERQILLFDGGGDGRVAEVFGDLDNSPNVAVMVPGVGSDIDGFSESLAPRAQELQQATGKYADNATVAWLGYNPPDQPISPAAASGDAANDGAPRLAQLLEGINARNDGHTTVIGHSYGSVTTGTAAASYGLRADDVVFTGSPGTGEGRTDVGQLGDNSRFWAAEAPGDPVPSAPAHGEAPGDSGFGARLFDATGEEALSPVSDHQSYYNPGSRSLENIARIVANRADLVTPPP